MSSSSSLNQSQLDRRLVSGIAWTGAVKWFTQALSWASTLVVARLLSPDDYGLVGMATVFIGLVAMINEFGIGSAVISHRNLDENQVSQINGLAVLVGGLCMILSWAAAVPIARFYDAPQLRSVVIVMSLTFVVYSLRSVPQAVLARDLMFKGLAKIEGTQVIFQSSSTVVFAWLGMGYWSLILGNLVGAATGSALVCMARPQRFALPRLSSIQEAVTFSQHIVVGRIAWYIQTNSDFLVAGRLLGKTALGYYTFALTLGSLPLEKVTALINQVTLPLFSSVQSDHAALRRYLLKLTELLSLVTFPLAWGLAVVASELVPVVLGEKWLGVIPPLQLLAFYAAVRSISPLFSQILLVVGESRLTRNISIVCAILMPAAFYFGSQWGTIGIAWAWILIHPLSILVAYRRVARKIGLRNSDYLRSTWPALSAGMLMIGSVLLVQRLLPADLSLPVLLGVEVSAGAAAYTGALFLFHRQRVFSIFRFLGTMRQSARTPEAA